MGFVEDGYDSAPAAYGAMAGDFHDLQALDGHGNVAVGGVVRRRLCGVVVENVRRQSCGQKPREVGAVVGVRGWREVCSEPPTLDRGRLR